MAKTELRSKAIQLRIEQRLSLRAIQKQLPVSKGTLSLWLKDFPLTDDEMRSRMSASGKKHRGQKHGHRTSPPGGKVVASSFCRPQENRHLRSSALGSAIEWFMSRGYVASIPLAQTPYDLIVESDSGLQKIQVKSTNHKDKCGRWIADIFKRLYDASRSVNAAGKRRRAAYRVDEVDHFFIITGDDSVYVIPLAATDGKQSITLDRSYAAYKIENGV